MKQPNFVLKLVNEKQVDAAIKAMGRNRDFLRKPYWFDWYFERLFWAGFWGAYLEGVVFENERMMAEALDTLHGPLQ